MARIAVLGAGVMGTALTFPPADNGHDIRLIGTHLDDAIIARCRRVCGRMPLARQLRRSMGLMWWRWV